MQNIAKLIKEGFDPYYSFSISFWQTLTNEGEILFYEKETCLKASGKTENHFYFILNGSGGVLLWNENNFICTDIILKNDFLCDFFSFLSRKPTQYEVVVFEKSELLKISHSSLVKCLVKYEIEDKFWRYATQAMYEDKHWQLIQAATQTAEQIYTAILLNEPSLLPLVPQKYIASYLGITPQSMSRIKRKSTCRSYLKVT